MSDYADGSVYIETGLDAEGFKQGSAKLVSAMDNLAQRIENLCVNLERAFSGTASNLRNVGAAASRAASDVNNATQQTERSTQRASSSASTYSQAMENARSAAQNMAGGQEEVDRAISKTEAELARLNARMEKQRILAEEARQAQIAQIREQAKAEMEAMPGWEKMAQWSKDAIAQEYEKDIQEKIAKLGMPEDSQAFRSIQYDIDITSAKLEGLLARKAELGESDTGGFSIDVNQLAKSIEGLLDKLAAAGTKAFHFVGSLNASAVRAFGNALSNAASKAFDLAKNLAKISYNAIAKGIGKVTSKLKQFSAQAKKSSIDAKTLVKSLSSIKRLLITRIKRTFISGLFKDVTEGIQRLAKFSDEFDKTMSRIKNSSTRLKGDIAVTIGSILQALEPIILKVINLLDRAITALNQFFALLGGKSTYTRAKQGTDDYAKSTEKAAGAQKKLNAELYSFDELTRQSDNSSSGGGSEETGIEYETVPIDLPQGIQDWIKKLKAAWENGDWYGVGAVIAEGLNKALEVADNWINNKFRPWAVKWASRIGQIINGFVDNFNWELLGKTIADGINAVFDALETFLDTVNWLNLGKGIGRAIKSWFDNIDWPMIGRVFAKKWNALINVIKGIVTTPGIWTSIGKSIGEFIKAWFETIDFDAIADVVIGILKGIPEAINAFLREDPFKGVPERIFNAINRVIHEVDWEELAGTLIDLFLYCVEQLRQVVAGIDWPAVFENLRNMAVTLAEKLIEWFGGIDWGYVAEIFAIGFNQLIGAIGDIVSQPGLWEGIGAKIGEAVKSWFMTIDLDAVAGIIIDLFNGLTAMIRAFLDGNPFEGVAGKISSAINRVLHEVKWAELFNTLGELFMKLLGVFLDVVKKIDWHAVGAAIGNFLGSINWWEVLTQVGNAIFTAFSGIISGLFSTSGGRVFMALFAAVKGLGAVFTMAKGVVALKVAQFLASSILGPITTGLGATLPAAITAAGPAILTALGGIATAVLVAVAGYTASLGVQLIQAQGELKEALQGETETAMQSMIKCYESGGQEMVTKWMEMAYGVKSTGEGMEADMRALAERIAELQGTSADEIYAQFTQNADLMRIAADESVGAIADSIEASSGKVTDAAQGMTENIGLAAQQLDEKITQPVDEMSQSVSTSAESMNTNASGSTEEMGENMKGTWDEVDTTWQGKLAAIEAALQTSMQNMIGITTQGGTDQTQPLFDRWGEVMEFIQLALQSIETALTTSMTTINTNITTGLDTATQTIQTTLTTVETAASEKYTAMETRLTEFLTAANTNIKTSTDSMNTTTETSLTKAESTVSTKLEAIATKIDTVMQRIGTNFDTKWKEIISVFERAMQSMETKARTSMQTLQTITLTAINSIKAQPWNTIGDAIVQGIGQGVNNRWPWLENLVRQRAQQLLQAAKAALGIASPSKLFEEQVGENVGLGWAQGIDNTKGDVLKTVSNVADAIVNEADGVQINAKASGVMDGVESVVGGMQAVLSELAGIASIFKSISDVLAGIGGFAMPQIAAGTVAPYKTKAAAESAPVDDSSAIEGHLTGIQSAIERLIEILQAGGNDQQDIRVIIDGREVFNVVVNENNRAIQRTGASPIRV